MGLSHSPRIVTDGLVFCLDAANGRSYDKSENLVSYSNYNVATWSKIEPTGTGTLTTGISDPFGGSNAVRLTCNNNGNIILRVTIPNIVPNGTDKYTISFYVRSVSGSIGGVISDLADDVSYTYTNDLITGQWVRVVYTGTPTATTKSFVDLYTDGNTNRVLDFYGLQVERKDSATDLVTTSGSTVTASTTWADLSGNDRNGTLTNGPSFSSANVGSIDFDGVNDRVATSSTTINYSSGGTFEIWFKRNSAATDQGFMSHNQAFPFINFWMPGTSGAIPASAGKMRWEVYSASGVGGAFYSSFVLSTNTWYHVVGTFDTSNVLKMYINGSLDSQLTGTTVPTSSTAAIIVGDYNGTGSYPSDSNIAIAKIYNRALTAAEVLQNFNALRWRFGL